MSAALKMNSGVAQTSLFPTLSTTLPFTDTKTASSKNVDEMLSSEDWCVREQAVKLHSLTPAQKDRALKDRAWRVRLAAVELGGLTPEQIRRGVEDDVLAVSDATIRSK